MSTKLIISFSIQLAICTQIAVAQTLYNGIELPAQWPPQPNEYATAEKLSPPYLKILPAVIPIDVGRQLFIDDFLIDSTSLTRKFYRAVFHEGNPVFTPDRPSERVRDLPFAAPVSDGIWYDPRDNLFKMWYMAGYGYQTAYAVSTDAVHWKRPAVTKRGRQDSNVLALSPTGRNSGAVWLDLDTEIPAERFKMLRFRSGVESRVSANGIHWSDAIEHGRDNIQDRSTCFFNPFRRVWVLSGRRHASGRVRVYQEFSEFHSDTWKAGRNASRWIRADQLDRQRPDVEGKYLPDLYNLDCIPYESLMLGMFTIHVRDADEKKKRPKINYVTLGYSRDGFFWSRPDRRAFMDVSEEPSAWNYGNVQSCNALLVMGDKLYFYCSGRNGGKNLDADASTGLAILRRDGFASMDGTGTLTTRPLTFNGKYLFINADAQQGEVKVKVLTEAGEGVAGLGRVDCIPLTSDSTIQRVSWKNSPTLASLSGKPVRLRFHLKQAKLYSFWVSPSDSGASFGYTGTGGIGLTGHRDTVGRAAYESLAKELK